mmetsp:Transcript_45360/g.119070  ORF Transcript_45360/g.119070 Transcript_45360/m.119070 type:complete len:284 (-) Transcript_45360:303-1154(-)
MYYNVCAVRTACTLQHSHRCVFLHPSCLDATSQSPVGLHAEALEQTLPPLGLVDDPAFGLWCVLPSAPRCRRLLRSERIQLLAKRPERLELSPQARQGIQVRMLALVGERGIAVTRRFDPRWQAYSCDAVWRRRLVCAAHRLCRLHSKMVLSPGDNVERRLARIVIFVDVTSFLVYSGKLLMRHCMDWLFNRRNVQFCRGARRVGERKVNSVVVGRHALICRMAGEGSPVKAWQMSIRACPARKARLGTRVERARGAIRCGGVRLIRLTQHPAPDRLIVTWLS